MSHLSIDPSSHRSLAVLVESVAGPLLMGHPSPVCLEVDIDAKIDVPADPVATVELVRTLTRQALSVMPDGGDLVVTGCETPAGVELELADTGVDVESRARNLPLAAAAIGAEVRWQNCPQGGGAVTIVFPRRVQSRRRAA
jgi:hypothetical protein